MTFAQILNPRLAVPGLLALGFVTVVPAVRPADAVPSYDGMWSVVIVTQQGICERSYRAPVRITNGHMLNAGAGQFVVHGRVGKNGAVVVTVSQGDKSATGTGRLSAKSGSGSWSGGPCAGTWHAERRS